MKKHNFLARGPIVGLLTIALFVPAQTLADTAYNDETGADSDNRAIIERSTSHDIESDNFADVDVDLDIDADTGDNRADANTGDGTVVSGDIDFEADVSTSANEGSTVSLTLPDVGTRTVTVGNSDTGANSVNVSASTIVEDTNIRSSYRADINNDIVFSGSTGNNSASRNTGDGFVRSGDINARISINNKANVKPVKPGEVVIPPTGPGAPGAPGVPGPGVVIPPAEAEELPVGGGEFPPTAVIPTARMSQNVPVEMPTLQAVAPEEFEGVGGGFFPAGSNGLLIFLSLLSLSLIAAYANPIKHYLSRLLTSLRLVRSSTL